MTPSSWAGVSAYYSYQTYKTSKWRQPWLAFMGQLVRTVEYFNWWVIIIFIHQWSCLGALIPLSEIDRAQTHLKLLLASLLILWITATASSLISGYQEGCRFDSSPWRFFPHIITCFKLNMFLLLIWRADVALKLCKQSNKKTTTWLYKLFIITVNHLRWVLLDGVFTWYLQLVI